MSKGDPVQEGDGEGGGDEPRTDTMSFLEKAGMTPFPFEGCSGQTETQMAIQVQLWYRHVWGTVVIIE